MRTVFYCIVAVAISSCTSPVDVCKTAVETQCSKTYECTPDALKATPIWQEAYGKSVAECQAKLEAGSGCATKKSMDDNCTGANAGKKFDLGRATTCNDKTKALSCADVANPSKIPAECLDYCK